MHGARPLRSTRRLSNLSTGRSGLLPWYRITNQAAGLPTQVSIYDEIGAFGVPAGEFLADLRGVDGDIEMHINSPGGDIFDGITIYNQLKSRQGQIHVIVDGLAASAASFISQAASPGQLEMAPRSKMMIHNGFGMAFGDATDMRKTADLLDELTQDIASIYAERSGKPVGYWLGKMSAETWYSDNEAVEMGLADLVTGKAPADNSWDMSVFARFTDSTTDGGHGAMTGTHSHGHQAYGDQGGDASHAHEHSHDGDFTHSHAHAAADSVLDGQFQNAGNGGWQRRDGKWVFDPDNDGDNDATPSGDTDHDYWSEDGKQLKAIPPDPDGKQGKPLAPGDKVAFPVLRAEVDNSTWDGPAVMSAGAKSDDPAKFYAGVCAGRKAGDADLQSSWALPYKKTPGGPPNAAGVKNALARLPQTDGLTNAAEAKATLTAAMKQVNPDYDPDALISTGVIAQVFTLPRAVVDDSDWDERAALAMAAEAPDPEMFYRGICAGRRSGDPATAAAWALPYKYSPSGPPNAAGVRAALARLPYIKNLANSTQARELLDKAMRQVNPEYEPDSDIDFDVLAAAFAYGLEGAK